MFVRDRGVGDGGYEYIFNMPSKDWGIMTYAYRGRDRVLGSLGGDGELKKRVRGLKGKLDAERAREVKEYERQVGDWKVKNDAKVAGLERGNKEDNRETVGKIGD